MGGGVGLDGVRLTDSNPHIEGLTITGLTGMAIGGPASASPSEDLAPTFAGITIAASVASLGEGPPDLWANLFNSDPTLLGSGWIQVVTHVSANPLLLSTTTTWGDPSIDAVHLTETLVVAGPDGPTLTILEGTTVKVAAAADIRVGDSSDGPGGLRVIGSPSSPVLFESLDPTNWGSIEFTGDSLGDSTILHAEFDDGGVSGSGAVLNVLNNSPALSDLVITGCESPAIRLNQSSSSLTNIEVQGFGPTHPAIAFVGSEDASLTGVNTIRKGVSGTGLRGIEIQGSAPPPFGPTISGVDIDEVDGHAIYAVTADSIPLFSGITVGPSVADVARGGPEFWARLLNSQPDIQGTGYTQAVLGGDLGISTTWSSGPGQAFSEIHLEGSLTVDGAEPVLTLAAGSTVLLANGVDVTAGLVGVIGAGGIVASGTPSQHIVFDSIVPGQRWGTITLRGPTALTGSAIEYCELLNGGSGASSAAALSLQGIDGSLPAIANVTIDQASNVGLSISGGTAGGILDGLTVRNCDVGVSIDQTGSGIVLMNGAFDSILGVAIQTSGSGISALELVEDCVFTDCERAIHSLGGGAALVVHQCQVSNWDQGAMEVAAVDFAAGSYPAILDSDFTGDGVVARMPASAADLLCHPTLANTYTLGANSRVELLTDTIEAPACWTNDLGVPFRVLGNVQFSAPLTIEEGVTIEVDTPSATIKPTLLSGGAPIRILGQSGSPVTFTAVGASWGGLAGGPNSVIEHAVIDGGGLASTQGLQLTGPCVVRDTTISNSLGYGFVQQDGSSTQAMTSPSWLIDCTLSQNASGGIQLKRFAWVEAQGCHLTSNLGEGGVDVAGESGKSARLALRECSFVGNSPRAISFNGVSTDFVDARFCWWDHVDGPTGGTQGIEIPGQAKSDPWFGSVLGAFSIADADVDPALFEPANSEVRWAGELSATGTWTLEIRDTSSQLVHTASGTDSIATSWDGADTEDVYPGTHAPDGTYEFILDADESGGAMASTSLLGTVELDSTGLIAEIQTPAELSFVAGGSSFDVYGTAAGSSFASYVLEYGLGSDPDDTDYSEAESDSSAVNNALLGTVDVPAQAEQGILNVRLRTLNGPQTAEVSSVRPFRLHSVVASAATPDPFSPNDDGFQDQTALSASMAWPSNWVVEVVAQGTSTVLESWSGTGTQITVAWDGTNQSQQVQPEGTYTFEITATEPLSTTVATAAVDVELSLAEKAVEITAPVDSATVMGDVDVTMNVDSPTNEDFHWRLEHGPGPTWSEIASGTASGSSPDIDVNWDSTRAPSGNRTLRATVTLADGTAHSDEVQVDIVNPDVVVSSRVFDPQNGESTTIQVNHGASAPTGSVVVHVKQATVSPTYYWVGALGSIGSVVWSSSPQALVAGAADIAWDGMVSPGVPADAGDYVVEAVVTYTGGATATYAEDTSVTYAVDNSLLVSPTVAASFDPYLGERVPIDFGLLEPAWVTMTYATGSYPNGSGDDEVHGLMRSVLHDEGAAHPGHTFQWDGRAVGRDGLAMGDGPVTVPNIRIKAMHAPRSLMTIANRRVLMDQLKLSPVAVHPLHGQVATLSCDLPYASLVSVSLVDTVASNPFDSEGTLVRALLIDSPAPAGPFELTIDTLNDSDELPELAGTYTVVIEAKDASFPTFKETRRLSLRILQ